MEIKRTCGSVRSSLSALAWLATAGSEAAETTHLHSLSEETTVRKSPRPQALCGLRARLDDTSKLVELPQAPRTCTEPKTLKGSNQKVSQSAVPTDYLGHTDNETAGVEAGANSSMLLERNTVNLIFRLIEAGVVVRPAVGVSGKGNWKKPMPFCNRTDRSDDITLPRKRADFQWVVRYETASRTFTGGNRK